MTQVRNLFFLFTITVFASTSTVLAIFSYDPFASGNSVLINFYVSLLVALVGVISLAFYSIKTKFSKIESQDKIFWPSIRQSIFIALPLTVILYLQGLHILDWLIGISIIVVAVLLELFFESKKKESK